MGLVVFRLLDKKVNTNSVYKNEDGTIDETKKRNFNNIYGLVNPYWVLVKGGQGKREVRQYIKGFHSLDPKVQAADGVLPNILNSTVAFKMGEDIWVDPETDGMLLKWLSDHPENVSSPFHNKDVHEKIFETFDPKKIVEAEKASAKMEDQALRIVLSLQDDEEKLKSLANLFEETAGLSDLDEMYLGLRKLAKEKPELFVTSIGNKRQAVLADIKIAKNYNLIGKNAKGYYLESTQAVIFETATSAMKQSDEELLEFLMNKKGHDTYRQIQIEIAKAQVEEDAPKD